MRQGAVRQMTGMFMVFMFQSAVGDGEGCSISFSMVSLVLLVIGGISDPTVPVPFVSKKFWAKFKL